MMHGYNHEDRMRSFFYFTNWEMEGYFTVT